jgi:antibiotic biosynthesis monooxygenase (ABM) superfamily enzyme
LSTLEAEAFRSTTDGVTVVTQTRPVTGKEEAFKQWQDQIGAEAAKWPSFLEQKIIPPSLPAQVDWVILQRFSSLEAASGWLHSSERLALVQSVQDILAGSDDIHIVKDGAAGVLPSAASAVISTRIRPGQETAYRRWEQRIASVQAKAPGFQGYRLEPPIPGVQEDWLAIIRFDSDQNLQNWLQSAERHQLLRESESLTDRVNTRIVHSGFDQWFPSTGGAPSAPVWKQNMIVLLLLYPVVFLFGTFVQKPLLIDRLKMPFWFALFIGNAVGIMLLNWLVPWTSNRFAWWLNATGAKTANITLRGAAVVVVLYAALLFLFSRV